MAKTFHEPEMTPLSRFGISSGFERLSIDDSPYYLRRSAISEDKIYTSTSDVHTPTKSPHLYGAKKRKLPPSLQAWLTTPLCFDSWNPLKIARDRYHNESKSPPINSSVCDYIDSDSTWKSTIDGSSTDSVAGDSVFKSLEKLHIHEDQELNFPETTRHGTTWPSFKLIGSKSQVGSQVESHVKTDRSSRKSRLLRPFRFHKRSGPNTEAALDHLPQTHPYFVTPTEVKIKEEFKDDSGACVASSDINTALPIHADSHSLELVGQSSLEMVDHAEQGGWRCIPETNSSETDSELSSSEVCSVDDDDVDDIFRTLPNKILAQVFSSEDSPNLGARTHTSGREVKGGGIVRPVESGEGPRLAQGSGRAPTANGRKRKCLNSGDGDEEDEDNTRDTKKEKLQTAWPPQLCPVFVANPSHADFRPGGKFTLCTKHISKIPQHMKRYHIRPEQCKKCGFRGDAGQVKDHNGTSCQSVPFDLVPPEDKKKENLLKQKRGLPWREVFEIQMGSHVSNSLGAKKFIACQNASSDFSRAFANYLKPKWESIIKDFYESSDYQIFSEQHPGVNFGQDDPSKPRSEIENIFVEHFLCPGRPPQWFGAPTPPAPSATKAIAAPVVVAESYPTPLSPSSLEKGGTTPSSQASLSSPQTDERPNAISQLSAPVQPVKVQSNCLAAKDQPLRSGPDSRQTYKTSENIKPPSVARQTSAERPVSFGHRQIFASSTPGTLGREYPPQSSAQHLAKSSSRISSQEPAQYNTPRNDMPVTTSHPSPMVPDELPSARDELDRRSIANVGARYLPTPPGPNDCSPAYSRGLNQSKQYYGFSDAPTGTSLYASDASEMGPSTCVTHEPFTQAYANPNNTHNYPLNQAQLELSRSRYQQNHLLVPHGQPPNLSPASSGNSSIPPESCFKHLAVSQSVAYEQSGVNCVECVLDASDGHSATSNRHADEWYSHQGDALASMASSNPAESYYPVTGTGSWPNGNTGTLLDLSCAERGIRYLYDMTVGQANSTEAKTWEG